MLEYLAFEYCKESEESHGFTLRLSDDGYYYLRTYHGRRGIYICGAEGEKSYRIKDKDLRPITNAIEQMKIYSWKKAYPSDYVPGDHLIGCDVGSWSLDYKESEKRTARHIHGKGNILETFPKVPFLVLFDNLFPDFNFAEWIA